MLDGIPDKRQDKNTTSLKFKEDLIEFFQPLQLSTCLEIGTNVGWTTRVLSSIFNRVITLEIDIANIRRAIEINKDRNNIEFMLGNVYESEFGLDPNISVDVSFIDCVHSYEHVKKDIANSLKYNAQYLVFDDYGLPEDVPSVKIAVDEFISLNPNVEVFYIGEPAGNEPRKGRPLVDWEGVIIKL